MTRDLAERVVDEELDKIRAAVGEETYGRGRWDDARALFTEVALADEFVEFLTLPAYARFP